VLTKKKSGKKKLTPLPAEVITYSELKETLIYYPDTGIFIWKKRQGQRGIIGNVAGAITAKGYLSIKVFGKSYLLHRLAWLYMFGEWPSNHIDHINGDGMDNRISNIRDVTRFGNQQNQRKATVRSKSGLIGASPFRGKWRASIVANGKCINLGSFDTPEEAHKVYIEAKRRIHLTCSI
jgi:hypothetical protein